MGNKILRRTSDKEWYYGNLSGDDGVQDGIGLKRERDGSLYYGEWKHGLRDGSGSLCEADGGLIVGKWEEDKLLDTMLRIWPVGSSLAVFSGKMENGVPREGTLLRSDGRIYHGLFAEWHKGEFHGEGALQWPDKRIYAGHWKNGGTDIGGVIRRVDGKKTGMLSNVRTGYREKSWQPKSEKQFFYGITDDEEVRNAQGILFYANGEFFAGKMTGGQRDGNGVYRDSDKSIYIGEWKNGMQQGAGMWFRWSEEAIDFYTGDFQNGSFDGEGCMLHREHGEWEFSYVGTWENGKRSGKGFGNFGKGELYIGGFCEDQRDGRGETVSPDGVRNVMNWKMGIPTVPLEEVLEPGPSRKKFVQNEKAAYVTFNSLKKNIDFGEEQRFVGIRADVDAPYQRFMHLEPGCDYEVRIFYHNDADEGLPNETGIAKETKLRTFFTKEISLGKDGVVSASISSENAVPPVVWDCVKISASEALPVNYKIASAKIRNSWKSNGHILPQTLFAEDGVYLGADRLDGILPPGESGFVTFILHTGGKKSDTSLSFKPKPPETPTDFTKKNIAADGVKFHAGQIDKRKKRKRSRISINIMATCGNEEYTKAIHADIGEEINVRIAFTNSAGEHDIMLKVALPSVVELINGSTVLALSDGSKQKQSDKWIEDGIFLTGFMPDGEGEVRFTLRYFPDASVASGDEKILAVIETEDISMRRELAILG